MDATNLGIKEARLPIKSKVMVAQVTYGVKSEVFQSLLCKSVGRIAAFHRIYDCNTLGILLTEPNLTAAISIQPFHLGN